MTREKIAEAVENIELRHVQEAANISDMQKGERGCKWKRAKITAAASVLLCTVLYLQVPAIGDSLHGFYQDAVRWWDGAVVGTEYKNAAQEIKIKASAAVFQEGKLVLPVEITFLEMEQMPYRYLAGGEAALGDYQILDASGTEVYAAHGRQEAAGILEDKKAVLMQPVDADTLLKGEVYRLVVTSVYGIQKAEQPLKMQGYWECEFTVAK